MAVRAEEALVGPIAAPESVAPATVASMPTSPSAVNNNAIKGNVQITAFAPMHAMSVWQNDECQKVASVPVLLPSGVSDKHQSEVSVSEDGTELHVEIVWPSMLSDASSLHKFWNNNTVTIPDSHPKIVGFHSCFQDLRKKDSDPIFSLGKIELPFPVCKSVTSIKRIGDKSGARIVCIELTALENADYLDKDTDDFCIV